MYGVMSSNQPVEYPVRTCRTLRTAKRIVREYLEDMAIVYLFICPKNRVGWTLVGKFHTVDEVVKFRIKRW